MTQNVLHAQSFGTLLATGSDDIALICWEFMLLWPKGLLSGPASGVADPLPSVSLFSLFLRRSIRAASHFWYCR
jgi:hypothetical protein